jgi:hypothetical protein
LRIPVAPRQIGQVFPSDRAGISKLCAKAENREYLSAIHAQKDCERLIDSELATGRTSPVRVCNEPAGASVTFEPAMWSNYHWQGSSGPPRVTPRHVKAYAGASAPGKQIDVGDFVADVTAEVPALEGV